MPETIKLVPHKPIPETVAIGGDGYFSHVVVNITAKKVVAAFTNPGAAIGYMEQLMNTVCSKYEVRQISHE